MADNKNFNKKYNIKKAIPGLDRSDKKARDIINVKESEIIRTEAEIQAEIVGESTKEKLKLEQVQLKKKELVEEKEEFQDELEHRSNVEIYEKEQAAKDKFANGYTDKINDYIDDATFNTMKAMEALNFKSTVNSKIKSKWENEKLKEYGDMEREALVLPNDTPDEVLQTSLRMNPDYYSSPRNGFIAYKSNIKQPLLIAKMRAIPVEYRDTSFINGDLGAFQLKLQLRGNDTSIDLELFSTLLSPGNYGCAIFSEGSHHLGDKLLLKVYKQKQTQDIFFVLENAVDLDIRNTMTIDTSISVLLGDYLDIPNDNASSFVYDSDIYTQIGEAEFEGKGEWLYGPIDSSILHRSYYSDKHLNNRVLSSNDLFGETNVVRITTIDKELEGVSKQTLPITARAHLHNAKLDTQIFFGENKKKPFINNYLENFPYLRYFDKEAGIMYLGTNEGLIIYTSDESVLKYHPEFDDIMINKIHFQPKTSTLYVLTPNGLYYTNTKNNDGIFEGFKEYPLHSIEYIYREDVILDRTIADFNKQDLENKIVQKYVFEPEDMRILDFAVISSDYKEDTYRDSKYIDFSKIPTPLEKTDENFGVTDYLEYRAGDDFIRILIVDGKIVQYKNFNEREEIPFNSPNAGAVKAQCLFTGIIDGKEAFGIIFDKAIFISFDLLKWEEKRFPNTALRKTWLTCKQIDFGGEIGKKFVAITDSDMDTHRLLVSNDGHTWFTKEMPNTIGQWRYFDIGYVGGDLNKNVLVIVASQGIGDRVVTTSDLESFEIRTLKFGGRIRGVKYVSSEVSDAANIPEIEEKTYQPPSIPSQDPDGAPIVPPPITYKLMKRGFIIYGETFNGQIGFFYSANTTDWYSGVPSNTIKEDYKTNFVIQSTVDSNIFEEYIKSYGKTSKEIEEALRLTSNGIKDKAFLIHSLDKTEADNPKDLMELAVFGADYDLIDNRFVVEGFKIIPIKNTIGVPAEGDIFNYKFNTSNAYEISYLKVSEYRGETRLIISSINNMMEISKYASTYIDSNFHEYGVGYHQEVVLLKLWLRQFDHNIPKNAMLYGTNHEFIDDLHKDILYQPALIRQSGMPKASAQYWNKNLDKLTPDTNPNNYKWNMRTLRENTTLFPGGMVVLGMRKANEKGNPEIKLSETFLIMGNEYSDDREFSLGSESSGPAITGIVTSDRLLFDVRKDFHPFQKSCSLVYCNNEQSKAAIFARGIQRVILISADKGNSFEWSRDEIIQDNMVVPFNKNAYDYNKNDINDENKIIYNISHAVDYENDDIYILEGEIEKPIFTTPPQLSGALKYETKIELIDWNGRQYDLNEEYLDSTKYKIWRSTGSGELNFQAGQWVQNDVFKTFYETYNQKEQLNFYIYNLNLTNYDNLGENYTLQKELIKYYLNIVNIDQDNHKLTSKARIKLEDHLELANVKTHFIHIDKSPVDGRILFLSDNANRWFMTQEFNVWELSEDRVGVEDKISRPDSARAFIVDINKDNYKFKDKILEVVLDNEDFKFSRTLVSKYMITNGSPWAQFDNQGNIVALLENVKVKNTDSVLSILKEDENLIVNGEFKYLEEPTVNPTKSETLNGIDGEFVDKENKYYVSTRTIESNEAGEDIAGKWSLESIDLEAKTVGKIDAKQYFNLPENEDKVFSIVKKLDKVPQNFSHAFLLFESHDRITKNITNRPSSDYFYVAAVTTRGEVQCTKVNFDSTYEDYLVSDVDENGHFVLLLEKLSTVSVCGLRWDGNTPSLEFINNYALPNIRMKSQIDDNVGMKALELESSWFIINKNNKIILRYHYGVDYKQFEAASKTDITKTLLVFDKLFYLTEVKGVKQFVEFDSRALYSSVSGENNISYYLVTDLGNPTVDLTRLQETKVKNIFPNITYDDTASGGCFKNANIRAEDKLHYISHIINQSTTQNEPSLFIQLNENNKLLITETYELEPNDSFYNDTANAKHVGERTIRYNKYIPNFRVFTLEVKNDVENFVADTSYADYYKDENFIVIPKDYGATAETNEVKKGNEAVRVIYPFYSVKLLKDNSIILYSIISNSATEPNIVKDINISYLIYAEKEKKWRNHNLNKLISRLKETSTLLEIANQRLSNKCYHFIYGKNNDVVIQYIEENPKGIFESIIPYSNQTEDANSLYNTKNYHFGVIDSLNHLIKEVAFDRATLPWASEIMKNNRFGIDFISEFEVNKITGELTFNTGIRYGVINTNADKLEINYFDYPEMIVKFTRAAIDGLTATFKVERSEGFDLLYSPHYEHNVKWMEVFSKANNVSKLIGGVSKDPGSQNPNYEDSYKINHIIIKENKVGSKWITIPQMETDLYANECQLKDDSLSNVDNSIMDSNANTTKVNGSTVVIDFLKIKDNMIYFLKKYRKGFYTKLDPNDNTGLTNEKIWVDFTKYNSKVFGPKDTLTLYSIFKEEENWKIASTQNLSYVDESMYKYSNKFIYNSKDSRIVFLGINSMFKDDLKLYRAKPEVYMGIGYISELASDGSSIYIPDKSKFIEAKPKGLTALRIFTEGFSYFNDDGGLMWIDPIGHRVMDFSKIGDFYKLWNDETTDYPDVIYMMRDYNLQSVQPLHMIEGVLVSNFYYTNIYKTLEQYGWDISQELIQFKDYHIFEMYYGKNDPRNHFLFINKKYNYGYRVTECELMNFPNNADDSLYIYNRKGNGDVSHSVLYKTLEAAGIPYNVPCKAFGYIIVNGDERRISAIKISEPYLPSEDDREGPVGGIELLLDLDVKNKYNDLDMKYVTPWTDIQGTLPIISLGANYSGAEESLTRNAAIGTEISPPEISRRKLGDIGAKWPTIRISKRSGYRCEIINGKLIDYNSKGLPIVIDVENNVISAEGIGKYEIGTPIKSPDQIGTYENVYHETSRKPNIASTFPSAIKSNYYDGARFIVRSCGLLTMNPKYDELTDWHLIEVIDKDDGNKIKIFDPVHFNESIVLAYDKYIITQSWEGIDFSAKTNQSLNLFLTDTEVIPEKRRYYRYYYEENYKGSIDETISNIESYDISHKIDIISKLKKAIVSQDYMVNTTDQAKASFKIWKSQWREDLYDTVFDASLYGIWKKGKMMYSLPANSDIDVCLVNPYNSNIVVATSSSKELDYVIIDFGDKIFKKCQLPGSILINTIIVLERTNSVILLPKDIKSKAYITNNKGNTWEEFDMNTIIGIRMLNEKTGNDLIEDITYESLINLGIKDPNTGKYIYVYGMKDEVLLSYDDYTAGMAVKGEGLYLYESNNSNFTFIPYKEDSNTDILFEEASDFQLPDNYTKIALITDEKIDTNIILFTNENEGLLISDDFRSVSVMYRDPNFGDNTARYIIDDSFYKVEIKEVADKTYNYKRSGLGNQQEYRMIRERIYPNDLPDEVCHITDIVSHDEEPWCIVIGTASSFTSYTGTKSYAASEADWSKANVPLCRISAWKISDFVNNTNKDNASKCSTKELRVIHQNTLLSNEWLKGDDPNKRKFSDQIIMLDRILYNSVDEGYWDKLEDKFYFFIPTVSIATPTENMANGKNDSILCELNPNFGTVQNPLRMRYGHVYNTTAPVSSRVPQIDMVPNGIIARLPWHPDKIAMFMHSTRFMNPVEINIRTYNNLSDFMSLVECMAQMFPYILFDPKTGLFEYNTIWDDKASNKSEENICGKMFEEFLQNGPQPTLRYRMNNTINSLFEDPDMSVNNLVYHAAWFKDGKIYLAAQEISHNRSYSKDRYFTDGGTAGTLMSPTSLIYNSDITGNGINGQFNSKALSIDSIGGGSSMYVDTDYSFSEGESSQYHLFEISMGQVRLVSTTSLEDRKKDFRKRNLLINGYDLTVLVSKSLSTQVPNTSNL